MIVGNADVEMLVNNSHRPAPGNKFLQALSYEPGGKDYTCIVGKVLAVISYTMYYG